MTASRDDELARVTIRKIAWRLLPIIALGYGVAYVDRVNISFAAVQMNADLHFTASIYGFGGGLFFLSYALAEVPSNLILARVGARLWLSRIMATWGLLAMAMMFVRTPTQFYVARLALGAAEAGFFPGVIYYLTLWFPARWRGRAVAGFYIAYPLSNVVMGGLAGWLLGLNGTFGLAGWQWLFLIEGAPAILMAALFYLFLKDAPDRATWLRPAEKDWLDSALMADRRAMARETDPGVWKALRDPVIWALGLSNLLFLSGGYTFALSAPTLLLQATGWSVTWVGYLVAAVGLAGGASMMANGAWADRSGRAPLHLAAALALEGLGYAVMRWIPGGGPFVFGYLLTGLGHAAAAPMFWLISGSRYTGRSSAAGVAAINAFGMVGSFFAPWAWGVAHDATGGYGLGLAVLPAAYALGAMIPLFLKWRVTPAVKAAGV